MLPISFQKVETNHNVLSGSFYSHKAALDDKSKLNDERIGRVETNANALNASKETMSAWIEDLHGKHKEQIEENKRIYTLIEGVSGTVQNIKSFLDKVWAKFSKHKAAQKSENKLSGERITILEINTGKLKQKTETIRHQSLTMKVSITNRLKKINAFTQELETSKKWSIK